jgi:hypothetical protein
MKLEEEDDHQEKYDPNAPETEEDGLIAGQLRILKIKQHCKESKLRSQNLLQLQNGAPIHEKTGDLFKRRLSFKSGQYLYKKLLDRKWNNTKVLYSSRQRYYY